MSEKTGSVPESVFEAPVYADVSGAPLPTAKTLRARGRLCGQFVSFMGFNLRIMKMVVTGHKQ